VSELAADPLFKVRLDAFFQKEIVARIYLFSIFGYIGLLWLTGCLVTRRFKVFRGIPCGIRGLSVPFNICPYSRDMDWRVSIVGGPGGIHTRLSAFGFR
jgi:hypothetical protein